LPQLPAELQFALAINKRIKCDNWQYLTHGDLINKNISFNKENKVLNNE